MAAENRIERGRGWSGGDPSTGCAAVQLLAFIGGELTPVPGPLRVVPVVPHARRTFPALMSAGIVLAMAAGARGARMAACSPRGPDDGPFRVMRPEGVQRLKQPRAKARFLVAVFLSAPIAHDLNANGCKVRPCRGRS